MRADDDGFINNPKKIQRMIGASDDDLKMLVAKKFIIPFESGIVVIKHWKIHNYIRGDRKKTTVYPKEMAQLIEKENGAYSLKADEINTLDQCPSSDGQVPDKCQHRLGKGSIGKDRLGKVRLVEGSIGELTDQCPSSDNNGGGKNDKIFKLEGTLGQGVVYLTQNQFDDLLNRLDIDAFDRYVKKLADFIISKNAKVANHYETILKWYKEDTQCHS